MNKEDEIAIILTKVNKELEGIKKAREDFENINKEFKDMKGQLAAFDYGVGKLLKALKTHEAGILELDDRLQKIEKKDKPKDIMYG